MKIDKVDVGYSTAYFPPLFAPGDVVKIASGYKFAVDWPGEFVVIGVRLEYHRSDPRWNYTIASVEDLKARYGATDDFFDDDLTQARPPAGEPNP